MFAQALDRLCGRSSSANVDFESGFAYRAYHFVKGLRIRSSFDPYFPAFGLKTDRYGDTEYLSVFNPNAGKYGPEKLQIRTLFTQCTSYSRRKCYQTGR